MENSVEVPQNIKNRTTIWSSNSFSWYLSKENKNTNSEIYTHPHVYFSIIYNNQDMETTYLSINRCMKKENVIYTVENYSAIGRKEIVPYATTWMNPEGMMLN